MKIQKQRFFKNGKPSPVFYFIFAAPSVGYSVMAVLLGYVTYFATNVLGLSSSVVGMLLLASKVFDGFTDIIAGYLIDRTNTRIGRARPYDLAAPLMCLFTIFLFAAPQMGTKAIAAYIFVVYTLIFSVWQTLFSCAGAVYMARAVPDQEIQIKMGAYGSLIATGVATGVAVFLPQLIAAAATDQGAWIRLAVGMSIPCIILGFVRIFLIPEVVESDVKTSINLKDGASMLFHNKYILLYALALLFANISANTSAANPYYFQYIVGDIGKQTFAALGNFVGPFVLLAFPVLSKKLGLKGIIQAGLVIGVVGRLLPLLELSNIPLIIVGAVLNTIAFMPIYMLANNVVIQCMDYGEWKFGRRGEGIYSCIIGFCSKVGTGLASAMVGIVMAIGGFDGKLEVQSASANGTIILLYTVIPAIAFIVAMVAMRFYDLDKKLPQIQKELGERRSLSCDKR